MTVQYTEISLKNLNIKLFLGTVTGLAHTKVHKTSQDNSGFKFTGDRLVVAVADGVGSCMYSANGSQVAVEATFELLDKRDMTDKDIIEITIDYWQRHLSHTQDQSHCTLHFAMFLPHEIILCGIGDGGKIINSKSDLDVIETKGEFVNCTAALPQATEWSIRRFPYPDDKMQVILATDGVFNEIETTSWREFCFYIQERMDISHNDLEKELQTWLEDLQANNEDDKTIAIICLEKNQGGFNKCSNFLD